MALDYGPGHTMTCFSRFWLSRPVDRDAFHAAVATLARDTPFLAIARRGQSWSPLDFDPDRQIDWGESSVGIDWRQQSADALVHWTARVGRLGDLGIADGVHEHLPGTVVVLRYPHAVADGLAAAGVIAELCRVLAGGVPVPPGNAALAVRHALAGTPAAARARGSRELARIARYFLRRPAEFAPLVRRGAAFGLAEVTCVRVVASTTATRDLVAASRAAGVTLNDVLVASLFRVLGSQLDPTAVIRIAVPTSLRPVGNTAFCNQVSMVFLDRVAARATAAGLLGGVAAEMSTVKRWRLGHAMHSFLSIALAAGDLPLRWFMRLPGVATTAVLSNLGDPFATADPLAPIRVVGHDTCAPLRPGTNIAIVACRHDGRLSLTLRFDPRCVSRDGAARLLDDMLATAAELLGVEAPRA